MAHTKIAVADRPIWVDLSSADPAGSRRFYADLFGWRVDVDPDPQYGGYALAKLGGKDVAGIGPTQSKEQPAAWSFYVGADDASATAQKVRQAGGKVIAPPFPVGTQGTMAVFQDPSGAFISVWQPSENRGFEQGKDNEFGWAELNARGIGNAIPFYETVFGWTAKRSEAAGEGTAYTEFQLDGESVAGAMEMPAMVPAEVPSYWLVYFNVDDVDATATKVTAAGGRAVAPPMDFPGGRFAVVGDPQGAVFGLLKTTS